MGDSGPTKTLLHLEGPGAHQFHAVTSELMLEMLIAPLVLIVRSRHLGHLWPPASSCLLCAPCFLFLLLLLLLWLMGLVRLLLSLPLPVVRGIVDSLFSGRRAP